MFRKILNTETGWEEIIHQHSDFPIHSIWLKTGKPLFLCDKGIVAAELSFNTFVVCGDPVVFAPFKAVDVLLSFIDWANQQGRPVCGYYFSKEVAQSVPLTVYQAGVSRAMNLPKLKLAGYQSRDIRRALKKAGEAQLSFKEIPLPEKSLWTESLKQREEIWRSYRTGPKIHFILSRLKSQGQGVSYERWFVVTDENQQIHAFATVLPWGSGLHYYVDQMVQVPGRNRFALDFLLSKLLLQLKSEGKKSLWLGLCVFMKISSRSDLESFFHLLSTWRWLYSSKGLYVYKRKFTNLEEPRFLLVDPKHNWIKQIIALSACTYPQFFKRENSNQ